MSQEIEKQVERFIGNIGSWWDQLLAKAKETVQTTETDLGENKKQIQVELPLPGEDVVAWTRACNARVLEAIPDGYTLKSSEFKEEKIVKHYATLTVEKT